LIGGILLTDTEIRKAKTKEVAYRMTDGRGLYLSVTPAGGKLWRWKYRLKGTEKLMSPEEEIVVSLIRQLSWTHFIALLPIKNPLQRDFYAELCRVEGWSVSRLRQKLTPCVCLRAIIHSLTASSRFHLGTR